VRPNRVGHYVLGELVTVDLLVRLVDLDDLLDTSGDVVGEKVFDGFPAHVSHLQKIFDR
jgi:hypothetical protein